MRVGVKVVHETRDNASISFPSPHRRRIFTRFLNFTLSRMNCDILHLN